MHITTGRVRLSYAHIWDPRVPEDGGDPKYQATLLIPKSDNATLQAIYNAIEQAKQDGLTKAFNNYMPPNLPITLYDSDQPQPRSGKPWGDECRGHMVLRSSSPRQPQIVDSSINPIMNKSLVYSGCYVRANVDFYAYNTRGNVGISCGLNAIQFLEDGEPLGGGVSAAEAFGGDNAIAGGYQAQYQQQPAYNQAPVQPQYQAQVNPGYQQLQQPAVMGGFPTQQPATVPATVPNQINPITGAPVVNGGIMGL